MEKVWLEPDVNNKTKTKTGCYTMVSKRDYGSKRTTVTTNKEVGMGQGELSQNAGGGMHRQTRRRNDTVKQFKFNSPGITRMSKSIVSIGRIEYY